MDITSYGSHPMWELGEMRLQTEKPKKPCRRRSQRSSIPYTDLKYSISSASYRDWQARWDTESYNKLFNIYDKVTQQSMCRGSTRHKDTVLTRLKIVHSYLTHSFILRGRNLHNVLAAFVASLWSTLYTVSTSKISDGGTSVSPA